ncbi:ATP-binding protein [Falsiroseomonas sp. CW058]|uniref:ATP-binding protein n=1 Tax=Falsiroseomonas sp. CW058 TaxID=3388664 RepID=UPI003D321803
MLPQGPPARRLLGAAALIGGVPSLALLALLLAGEVTVLPGLLALLAVAAAALALARIWLGSLGRLSDAMRRAEAGEAELPEIPGPPLLPSVAEIAEGVRRLARSQRERAELVVRLRRADEAIVEKLPDPLVVLDAAGQELRANAAARLLFGTAAGGGDLAALRRHPALAEALDAALADAAPRQVDVSLPVPVARELLVHVIPMEPPLADGGRVVLLLSDRTRDRAVERMRVDFVANASHELRTPLASLIGFIETLRGPAQGDAEAQARFLGIMAEQSERMRRLIDDLLGLSRIEITEHQPPTGRVDLGLLAASEAAAMAPILAGRAVTLESALAEGAVAAPADAGQLAQVVRNLLENAVRYGRDGGTVRLSVARAEPGGRWPSRPGVVLAVADDGPGIARHHLPRLTERFYRVDRGRARHAGGTGLGLAIVKHVVNRHRGQLAIESEEGAGAAFLVWLPAEG